MCRRRQLRDRLVPERSSNLSNYVITCARSKSVSDPAGAPSTHF